ncbi:hypothetical protein OGAPHI_002616 [Ogataea philodendri]|uniref:Coiled-coil domain-containing protein 47 n=1 Tax=Ogataea philodendri TaxID=1378263 RepID=A0A9P8PBR6_9ASCO|nr:uncharacterized protein OGAPHI_002616 [Ogataea philodendri]KAH3668861.1 hypothetical protein OGAPHI_002616 [Ogataea philodendri]
MVQRKNLSRGPPQSRAATKCEKLDIDNIIVCFSSMLSLAIFTLFGTCLAQEATKKYSQYTPAELSELGLVERLKLYPWTLEMISVGFISVYFVSYYVGSRYNDKLVNKFINTNLELLKEQFYQVGVTRSQLLAKDDAENYSFYATGRLNIESLTAKIKLQPRQNIFVWIMESLLSFFIDSASSTKDVVDLVFQIDKEASTKYDDFIWAIVSKDNMNSIRNENYFLSLTRTAESAKLPLEFVFMNEVPEMNEVLYHKKFNSILEKCKGFLSFIAITDQPAEKPELVADLVKSKRIVVQMKIPQSSADLEASNELLKFLLNDFIEYVISKGFFIGELNRRPKKTRENELAKLKKVEETLKKEELANKKLEEQKKQKASMSAEKQRKLEKKQLERKQRRNTQKVRQ